jgi:hypothetical protein
MKTKKISIVWMAAVCLMLSCSLITTPTTQAPDSGEPGINVETSVARTRAFDFTVQTAAAGVVQPPLEAAPTTDQAQAPAVGPTSDVPIISASIDTNCRTGPSQVYEAISYLLIGKTSEVVKKYQNGLWWVIKDPNNPSKHCWVWGSTTSVTGNWQQLAEATIPPTPTVNLSIEPIFTALDPSSYVGVCPVVLSGQGTITVNGPTTVTYVWERSSGPSLGSGSLTFAAAGSQNISFSINYLSTSIDTVRLHVTSPIDISSDALPYDILCTPY